MRLFVNILFSVLAITTLIGLFYNKISWWVLLIIAFSWLLITGYGVITIRSGYFLKALSAAKTNKTGAIAITFDDGPDINTLTILEVLRKFNVKATFFCIGQQVEKHPNIAQKIIDDGHVIANHTQTHAQWIDLYGTKRFTEEIKTADYSIEKYTGKRPLLFRPPYGVTNPNIARAIKETKHHVIGWNKRSFDTTIPSAQLILKRITKNLTSGDVILLHDTKEITVTVLEQLLLVVQSNNLTPVTIDELFEIPAYA
ncbi:polysaccharide deacetylase family protein [Aquimarina intermedia]|uniref:Peptidoglycan/xylan/chitin deacetylase (PgdA/CDA1 family) n=1 Tax=Aquimarina intermedia TaxID=350814 RepID=A0A5S5C6V9_9FLAO|nr:polysaccharide deacetylase family protein [Aquimarina intermedia]TYP74212.1 peptidoglycan/xylan/chitin deacetylase (PgdA/CDA1 family) [Aquimarina intermedia]